MADPTLRAELWIKAQVRICDNAMLSAFIRRRGDPDAGAVIIKLDRLDGSSEVFTQTRNKDGTRAWTRGAGDGLIPDVDAESYITRQAEFDPDIWVLEIEDPNYRYKFDEPLIT